MSIYEDLECECGHMHDEHEDNGEECSVPGCGCVCFDEKITVED